MKIKKYLQKHFSLQPQPPNSKIASYKCNYCTRTYAMHTTRMSNHLYKCKGSPAVVKQVIKEAQSKKSKKSKGKKGDILQVVQMNQT